MKRRLIIATIGILATWTILDALVLILEAWIADTLDQDAETLDQEDQSAPRPDKTWPWRDREVNR